MEITSFVKNGITFERKPAPPPMGPLGSHVFGLVGTAPDADASLPKNQPIRIDNRLKHAKLDTTGNERGSLWRVIDFVWQLVEVPFYVVIVDEGADAAAKKNNIIGGVNAGTGQLTGIEALLGCQEKPTHIYAPGDKDVIDKLVAMGRKLNAVVLGDGPNTNDEAAKTLSKNLGTSTDYNSLYVVDPHVHVYSKKAKGDVAMSGAAAALACFGRVNIWESPAADGNVPINGTARVIDHSITDKSTAGNALNKHGISYFARSNGFNLIGNRAITGVFINKTGLELAIIRKLTATSQAIMGKNLTKDFIESEIEKLNTWLESLQAGNTIIGARVYLHPTLNNTESYQNGEWHIAINYSGYSPNEHTVYHLTEDLEIVNAFVEGLK